MVVKQCSKCGEIKEHLSKKNGYCSSPCKDCRNKASKLYYEENKEVRNKQIQKRALVNKQKIRDFIIEAKSKPCTDCDETFHHSAMDFDHLGGKEFNISDAVRRNMSLNRIQTEINKCELVCSNCHRIRTWKRLNGEL